MITLIVIFIVRDGEVDCADYQWLFKMSDQNVDGVVYMNDFLEPIWSLDGDYTAHVTVISDEDWAYHTKPKNFDQFCDIMLGEKEAALSH